MSEGLKKFFSDLKEDSEKFKKELPKMMKSVEENVKVLKNELPKAVKNVTEDMEELGKVRDFLLNKSKEASDAMVYSVTQGIFEKKGYTVTTTKSGNMIAKKGRSRVLVDRMGNYDEKEWKTKMSRAKCTKGVLLAIDVVNEETVASWKKVKTDVLDLKTLGEWVKEKVM